MCLSKKSLIVYCVVPTLLVLLFSLKDRLGAWAISVWIRRALPEAQFTAREVHVGAGVITIRDFSMLQKPRGDRPRREVKGSLAEIRYSLTGQTRGLLSAVRRADIRCDVIMSGPVFVRGLDLQAHRHPQWPYLSIRAGIGSLAVGQKEIRDIAVFMLMDQRQVLLNDLRAGLLGGQAGGKGIMESSGASASFVFDLEGAQLKDVMAFVGGQKSIDAGGIFNGGAVVRWRGGRLEFLRGELNSVSSGWFRVSDPSLLGQEFKDVTQNIVIENLKNYDYDIGKVELRNLGQDIRMDIILEGKAGRRILELFWHREGQDRHDA